MNGSRILAVDPGRTTLGVAVFEDATLLYYGVKTLRVPGTPAAVRNAATTLLNDLIATYQPTHLALEQPLVMQHRSELLAHVIIALKTTARRKGLRVSEYAPQTIRRYVCVSTHPTKREAARLLAVCYPELSCYITAQSRWAEAYYEKIFGAVAVGVVAFNTQKHRSPSDRVGTSGDQAILK